MDTSTLSLAEPGEARVKMDPSPFQEEFSPPAPPLSPVTAPPRFDTDAAEETYLSFECGESYSPSVLIRFSPLIHMQLKFSYLFIRSACGVPM